MDARTLVIAFTALVCACSSHGPQTEVEWFKGGPYIGGMIGAAGLGVSSGDLADELAGKGHVAAVDLDSLDAAFAGYGGYRFDRPFALEAGYMYLGQVDSTTGTTSSQGAYLQDLADSHPFLGEGVYLNGRWYPIDTDRVQVGLGVGAWFWSAKVDTRGAVNGRLIEKEGLDPMLGIDVLIDLSRRVQLRAEYDHIWLDGQEADVLLFGLQFSVF